MQTQNTTGEPQGAENRDSIITRIVQAARKPCPEITEIRYLLCDDGQYRGAGGIPLGVNAVQPYQVKVMGYAFRDRISGATYGTRGQSEQEMRERFEATQDKAGAEFKAELESMSADRLQSQADYWLK